MTPKSNRKSVSKEEYYKLLAYQSIHNQIMILLENLELDALEITQEIDPKDSFDRYLLGGLTSDLLNNSNPKAVDDVLRLLGLTVEDDKAEKKSMKDIGKVEKKKFKSGIWKGKKGVEVEFDESPEMKRYLAEHCVVTIAAPAEKFVLKNQNPLFVENDEGNIVFTGTITARSGDGLFDNIQIDEN